MHRSQSARQTQHTRIAIHGTTDVRSTLDSYRVRLGRYTGILGAAWVLGRDVRGGAPSVHSLLVTGARSFLSHGYRTVLKYTSRALAAACCARERLTF